jgi:hypothetical protein
MVNKAAVAVLGVIVLVSMGIGILIGMQLEGPTGQAADSDTNDTGTASGGPTTVPTGDSTPSTGEGPGTLPPMERTTMPARRFDDRKIEAEIASLVNQRRSERGLDTNDVTGNTADAVRRMARNHSVTMADGGALSHNAGGTSSEQRYRNAGLYEACKFESDPDTYIVDAQYARLEVIGRTYAGQSYQDDGMTAYNANETEVARAIVDEWFSTPQYESRLTYENSDQFGVGVEVTRDGLVYVTGNVC